MSVKQHGTAGVEEEAEDERFLSAVTPEDGNQDTCKTFIFKGEGHTLGNALRFVIASYEEVIFCAYTIPHPGENVMHLRIETSPGNNPQHILQRGLHDLISISQIVTEEFEKSFSKLPSSSSRTSVAHETSSLVSDEDDEPVVVVSISD